MTPVTLHIPCLVQQHQLGDASHYFIRPLFLGSPVATHPRFDQALETLRQQLRNELDFWTLNRSSLNAFLWYAFDPDIQYHKPLLRVQVGNRELEGIFSLITFQLQGKQFGLLPALDHHLFLQVPKKGKDQYEQCQEVVEHLLKKKFKEEPSGFDISNFTRAKKEFITPVELEIQVRETNFKFQVTEQPLLARFMSGAGSFDGSTEIRKVAELLNAKYPSGLSRSYFREEETVQLQHLLYRESPAPIAIIGPEGSGRHSLLEEILFQHQRAEMAKAEDRQDRNMWLLDPNQVIAGMSIVGWWEKRFESILNYLREVVPAPEILVIDNPLALLRIGRTSQSSLNLAHLLRPYLEKREIPTVLIATPGQWKLFQEQDPALSRQFQKINLESTNVELATRIALKKRRWLEKQYNCQITIPALQELFRLHRNYFSDFALPGYVIKQMEQLVNRDSFGLIDLPQVRQAFSNLSGWKDRIFDDDQPLQPAEIESRMAVELVGQPEAVEALGGAVNLVRSNLNNPGKPYSSFLFVGPTGVGKTQAAKVLCRFLTGTEKTMIRLDMNEYLDPMAAQRLIGTFRQPEGHLTSRVRYQPFSVILLDEIEKADQSVVDLLLQVLDDGRLTDSRGRRVDFSNTFIIMTSNLGSREAASRLGFRSDNWDESSAYQKALRNHFRPEFLNRIDRTVIFRPLAESEILNIAQLQIRELLSRDGFVRRTTILNISAKALAWVAKRGYDPKMGGRALKRQIERDLTRLSAEQLVRIPDDHPILLDIDFIDEQLVPKITRLVFASPHTAGWYPQLPEEHKGGSFYRKLLNRLERLEKKILDLESPTGVSLLNLDHATENWQYYHFRNRIAEQKERIQTLLLGHRDPNFRESPVQPFRFRSGAFPEQKQEGFFRAEQLNEFREQFRLGKQHFSGQETELLEEYVAVAQLEKCAKHVLADRYDQVKLFIEPCVNNSTDVPLNYLFDRYMAWLSYREIQHEPDHGAWCISAEDFGLADQLLPECGLHFFYGPLGSPVPIRLRMEVDGERVTPLYGDQVLRIYDQENTLIDLRSGFANDYYSTPAEWNLLVFAGMQEK